MLTKPSAWDYLKNKKGSVYAYRITIGEDKYTSLNDIEEGSLKLSRTVFSSSAFIGNTPCATLECCLRLGERTIPKGADLKVEIQVKNGSSTSGPAPIGVFKIHRRQEYSDGWVKLTCRDKMQRANQGYFQEDVVEDEWPKSMKTVIEETVTRVGVTLDSRTVIQEGEDWVVTPPVDKSIRAVWGEIAAAHGGNFIITPNDTLLLVVPKTTTPSVELECGEDNYELLGEPIEIDMVTLNINSQTGFSSGESGDTDIEADCPYANKIIVDYAKQALSGQLYTPIKLSNVWIDPLMEVQDSYTISGLDGIQSLCSSLEIEYQIICSAKISAIAMGETESEYGFEDTPVNQLKTQSSRLVGEALEGLSQEDIFNKLTDQGKAQGIYIQDGQLYINASYIQSGTVNADLIKTGTLQSPEGNFVLNLDTGELAVAGYASEEDLNKDTSELRKQLSEIDIRADGIQSSVSSEIEGVKTELSEVRQDATSWSARVEAIEQDGVDKITTGTGITLDKDGLHVDEDGKPTSTLIDASGMDVTRRADGQKLLEVRDTGVKTENLSVRNYVIFGYTRFEKYSDSNDSTQTAMFFYPEGAG